MSLAGGALVASSFLRAKRNTSSNIGSLLSSSIAVRVLAAQRLVIGVTVSMRFPFATDTNTKRMFTISGFHDNHQTKAVRNISANRVRRPAKGEQEDRFIEPVLLSDRS